MKNIGWSALTFLAAILFSCAMGTRADTPSSQEGTISFTLAYDGNGAESGSLPAGAASYPEGTVITVPGNGGSLAKGHHGFSGWNTAANGLGNFYAEGDTLTLNGDTTLYAVWTIDRFTVSFATNGGTGIGDVTADYGSLLEEPADPMRNGFTFQGWYKDPELTDRWDFAADRISDRDIILHAGWTADQGLTVTIEVEGGDDLSFEGTATFAVGDAMGFSVAGPGAFAAYRWYWDGALLSGENSSSVTIDTGADGLNLTAGKYELSALCTDGDGISYSGRIGIFLTN